MVVLTAYPLMLNTFYEMGQPDVDFSEQTRFLPVRLA